MDNMKSEIEVLRKRIAKAERHIKAGKRVLEETDRIGRLSIRLKWLLIKEAQEKHPPFASFKHFADMFGDPNEAGDYERYMR